MNIERLREYSLSLPFVEEDFPFGSDVLCFRLCGKIFLMIDLDKHSTFANMKCLPDLAIELRERYHGVQPGWHMNKKHWNSVYYQSDVDDILYLRLVRHAYNAVLATLPLSIRKNIQSLDE